MTAAMRFWVEEADIDGFLRERISVWPSLDDKGTGTYTEGQTAGRRMHVAGTISKMWVDTLDESAASGACVVKIRNKGVADISGISLTVADGATRGESEGSATITGTEELIFACDAATGWGSNYFRCGFLFTPAT